jgi:hypothetical protein
MKVQFIRVAHVEFIPTSLDEGVLYVSRKYRTASHHCCCGCGTKIVTPLRETEYELIERDGLVSLHPSIGNWNHPCQSHYWIRDNHIVWAAPMSKAAIQSGRAYDDAVKAEYFAKAAWPWRRRAWSRIRRWLP